MYRAVYEKNNTVVVVPPENQEPMAQPTEEEMNNVE
jgi:hypothetical protein